MIEGKNVSVSFGEKTALHYLNFTVPTDGVTAVSGPSGCGKTTLLKLLAGLIIPTAGTIHGADGLKFGVVFQENRLLPWMTTKENVAIISDTASANALLGRFGLREAGDMLPKALSGGMQRRVALARALAFRPDFLLLDEPFNGLDEETLHTCAKILLESNLPMLVITHHPEEADLLHARHRIQL